MTSAGLFVTCAKIMRFGTCTGLFDTFFSTERNNLFEVTFPTLFATCRSARFAPLSMDSVTHLPKTILFTNTCVCTCSASVSAFAATNLWYTSSAKDAVGG